MLFQSKLKRALEVIAEYGRPWRRLIYRFLTLIVVFSASASSRSADITGWSDLRWGTTKAVALKTLQSLGAHDCHRTKSVVCAEAAGADVLVIEKYRLGNVPFTVTLFFTSKNGLSQVIMTAEDRRDAFAKILSDLTVRYGKPGLQSDYNGDDENTHTIWIWSKAHGKLTLESEETGGVFTVSLVNSRNN